MSIALTSPKNDQINDLSAVPFEQRDSIWENKFFNLLVSSNLTVVSPDPQIGPDQWPYILVRTDGEGKEPAGKIISWLAGKGIGLVVNPHKDYPDYVFSFGMIWSFVNTGLFFREKNGVIHSADGRVEINPKNIAISGEPTKDYLPDSVRQILREFFRDQGLHQVKVNLISLDNIHFDLCFSLESLGNPPESEHNGIAEAISWFLPPHYSILLVSEIGLPKFINI